MNRKTEVFKKENLIILFSLLIIFLITFGIYLSFSFFSIVKERNILNNTVVRVIDGDTFELASGEIVRMLCIDTPEKNQAGYEQAKQFLSSLILNKEVRLEKENSETDSYGRLLRYVYVNDSENSCSVEENKDSDVLSGEVCFSTGNTELFINKKIIDEGFGSLFVYGNDKCERMM